MARVHVELGEAKIGIWKKGEERLGVYSRRFKAHRNHPRLNATGILLARSAVEDSLSPVLLVEEASGDLPDDFEPTIDLSGTSTEKKRPSAMVASDRDARGLVVSGLRGATTRQG